VVLDDGVSAAVFADGVDAVDADDGQQLLV
jgi:hypothetical protein